MLALILGALAAEPVAVVELFTSQGCSSCPAADAVLAGIASQARKEGHPVYVMSFHVDYWNKLGWKDPYSDARWTGRQREYAASLGRGGRVYTPMVVVNGTQDVVGSEKALVKGLIAGALMKESAASVSGVAAFEPGFVTVQVATEHAPASALLYVAVLEPELRNAVPSGENKGKELVHANVVRAMVKVDVAGSRGRIPLPEGVDASTAEVFAWLHDGLTNEVIGAGMLERKPSE